MLDIPFVRHTCGFLFFTTIPGLMVIYALRVTKTGPLKTGVMAVDLRPLVLIFAGLFFNRVYSAAAHTNQFSVPYLPPIVFRTASVGFRCLRLNIEDRPFVTVPTPAVASQCKWLVTMLLIPSLFLFLHRWNLSNEYAAE